MLAYKNGEVKLRIMWAQLEYNVYANGIEFINLTESPESTDSVSEQAQQKSAIASWMYWGHQCHQILVWSIPTLLIIHVWLWMSFGEFLKHFWY